jgi:hypothetical protein
MTSISELPAFSYSHVAETTVPASAIWDLYEDVTSWPRWDAQAELITRDGPFATGTNGTMKFTGQEPLRYRLAKVHPLREFIDVTDVGELTVQVSHLLEPIGDGRLRITYAARIDGPPEQAAEIGPAITADFPGTMNSLIALASKRAG